MAIIHQEGFDLLFSVLPPPDASTSPNSVVYGPAARTLLNDLGWTTVGQDGNFGARYFISEEGQRVPGAMLVLLQQSGNSRADFTIDKGEGDDISVGFMFRGTERAEIARIMYGTAQVCALNWTEQGIEMLGERTAGKPIRNRNYHVEILLNVQTRRLRLRLNGYDQISTSTSIDFGTGEPLTLQLGGKYGTKVTGQPATGADVPTALAFDHLTIGRGPDPVGPTRIVTLAPGLDVVSEWSKQPADAASHYELVSGRVNDNRFVYSGVTGQTDLWRATDSLPDANAIKAVTLLVRAQKSDVDDRVLGILLDTSAAQLEYVVPELKLDWAYYSVTYTTAKDGKSFDPATLPLTPFGVVAR